MAILDASLTTSQGVNVTIAGSLIPAVDVTKTRHLVVYPGDVFHLRKGELGAVLDFFSPELNITGAVTGYFKIAPQFGVSINVPAYVAANGALRRVLDGSEALVIGPCRVWAVIDTPIFKGALAPFILVVDEVAP